MDRKVRYYVSTAKNVLQCSEKQKLSLTWKKVLLSNSVIFFFLTFSSPSGNAI